MINATKTSPENAPLCVKFYVGDFYLLKDMHYMLIGLIFAHRTINTRSSISDEYYNAAYALSNIYIPDPETRINHLQTGNVIIAATILLGVTQTLKVPIDSLSTTHVFLSAYLNTGITDPIKFTTELIVGYSLYSLSTMTALVINPTLVIGFMIGYSLTDSESKDLHIKFIRYNVEKKVNYVVDMLKIAYNSFFALADEEEVVVAVSEQQNEPPTTIIGETDFNTSES